MLRETLWAQAGGVNTERCRNYVTGQLKYVILFRLGWRWRNFWKFPTENWAFLIYEPLISGAQRGQPDSGSFKPAIRCKDLTGYITRLFGA